MSESWTIRRVVAWTTEDFQKRGLHSARLEADLLIAEALGIERIGLYMDPDRPLTPQELAAIRVLVGRRRLHEPVAYILGRREFYGRTFKVTPDVLIPRPDTETLVEHALTAAAGAPAGPWVELCTGSGAVAITLAIELPERSGVATDLSEAALAVARHNAEAHQVGERLSLRAGDLCAPLDPSNPAALMLVNPPYIRAGDLSGLDADVRDHEPRMALDGGADGLTFYRRLAAEAGAFLLPGARLMMEVGYDQAAEVAALFAAPQWDGHATHDDLAGTPRVVSVQRSDA